MYAPMKKFFSENHLLILLAVFLSLHMLVVPFLVVPELVTTGPSWLGVDDSWAVTLNYALAKNWTWGKDIVYTYGPLGFLATRVGMGISKWIMLGFDLLMVVNFFCVCRDFLTKMPDRFLSVLLIIGVVILMRPLPFGGLVWLLLFFQLFWMYRAYLDPKPAYFLAAGGLAVLTFYIKLNGGLFGIPVFITFIGLLFVVRKITRNALLVSLGSTIGLLLVSAFLLHVYLPGYIRGAFYIIKGSNDVMYLEETHEWLEGNLELTFVAMMLFMVAASLLVLKSKDYVAAFLVACCAAFLFLLRKQSIVRNDLQHLEEFYRFAPLILLLLNLILAERVMKGSLKMSFLMVLFLLLCYTGAHHFDFLFKERYGHVGQYAKEFGYNNEAHYTDQQGKRFIPMRVLEKIGSHTIDIFPWDIEYIIQNKLNYRPRPMFQSIMACTEQVQQLNLDAYMQQAPDFLIYDYDAIDNRYPFSEEGMMNLAIVQHYALADTFTSNERPRLLLHKQTDLVPLEIKESGREKFAMMQEIDTKQADMIKAEINYSLKGKIRAAWYKPSPLRISLQRRNGQWLIYKTSPELLKAGLMVGKLIQSTQDFSDLITGNGYLEPVLKIKLDADSNYYDPEIAITFFKVKGFSETNVAENNNGIVRLAHFKSGDIAEIDHEKVLAIWGGEAATDALPREKGRYKLGILAKGTPVEKGFPELDVFVNGKKAGRFTAEKDYRVNEFSFTLDADSVSLSFVMTNDYYNPATKEDRNAFIKTITLKKDTGQ